MIELNAFQNKMCISAAAHHSNNANMIIILPEDASERLLITALSLYDNINGTRPVFLFFYSPIYCAAAKTNLQQCDTAGGYLTDPFFVLIRIEKVTLLA